MRLNKHMDLMQEMMLFVAVVNNGSFSETARQLGVSPSAISRAIKVLEQRLDVCLLQRTTRKLRLSEMGRAVYKHCLDIERSAKNVISLCESHHHTAQGLIKIAAPKAIAYKLIHPIVLPFLDAYPQIDVHLVLDDKNLDLIHDEIDILFKITDEPPQGLIGRSIKYIDHILVASPKYLREYGIPKCPENLKNHSCVALGETDGDSKWQFRRGTERKVILIQGRYKANHTRVRLDAALQSIGIASIPTFIASSDIKQGNLVQVLPEWEFETKNSGDLWMLYPATRHIPPKVSIFADYIVGRLTEK